MFHKITLTFIVFLFIFLVMLHKGKLCSKFIRIDQLKNTLPKEAAASEFESTMIMCLMRCESDVQCRVSFYDKVSSRCRQYKTFDYKNLRPENSSSCYAKYLRNVALGKPTNQSSTYLGPLAWSSNFAVDGVMITSPDYLSYPVCASTDYSDYNPWWYVDLLDSYIILTVRILNRAQNFGSRLKDIEVRLGQDGTQFDVVCAFYYGPATDGELVTLRCAPYVIGRYVKVWKPLTSTAENYALNICEVQVAALKI